ncbi:hypothetical protein QYE76_058009 [Lolium multiflorum]|uniref:Reverse transcriptase domain-containing protein n=1 Tax=Lolium multiflorum TaxID=4521 RepID=A0AAD8WS19_LOLMU|nr:hypothetical protein QYE76_058009 [Lolium multiflorum]
MKRLTSGEPLPPPPPPPPAGGPGPAGTENANLEHHEANQVHHAGRYLAEDATYIIFTSEPEDRTSQERRSLEVNAVIPPVPQYLNWSEQAITFDRRGRVAPTPTVFHGIVPGHCCQPIGRITLEVMFGQPDHFRTERIEFEVVDPRESLPRAPGQAGPDQVHGGAPLWVPEDEAAWPQGVITVAGDYRRSMDCATQSSKMAQTLVIATEKQLIHDAVALAKAAQTDMPAAGNPAGTTHFQPADHTKKILLDPAQPDKYVTIGATYQRCMQKCLQDQIGRNVHAYVDDVVVKTKETTTLLDDLRETFTNLRRFWMKLNPAKCTFGVPSGQLLGCLVSQRGIEANPNKISALEKMELPQCLKDVRSLLAAWPP